MSKINKKITLGIVIDTDFKIPPVTGVTYRLYYLSKYLTKKGLAVKIFICNRNIKNKNDEKLLYENSRLEYHIIPEDIFYNKQNLFNIIKDNGIDILQFEDSVSVLRCKEISKNLNIPICLEMHDVEASLKEMLNYREKDIKKTKEISESACETADKIICMTPLDYSELIHKIGADKNKLTIIPNPIDPKAFKSFGPNTKSYNIIFIGNMFYWPNQNAALNIINKVVPKVLSLNKNAKFYFIGMVPEKIKKFGNKNIVFTGKVKDINYYLKKATLALCPVCEGSGMKVKILNYCAAGIPVITTIVGRSGYEKVKSLIIENKISNYPNIIRNLLKNKDKLLKIGRVNRKYIEKNFNIELISKKIIKIYQNILLNNGRVNKKISNNNKVPLPLWLSEKRVKKIKNNNYYIIKNGKTIFKKKIA
jgi:glycosyltransferase involved in cell wall biosynthesis